jgi:hypothetical protein
MAAAEGSYLGLARQTNGVTENVTDADFKYLLFREGGFSPQNVVIPLDDEIGGGALLRNVVKVGVTGGGALDFIPRPETLGHFFAGALGKDASVADGAGGAFKHTFTLADDEFSAPYYTLRSVINGVNTGEVYPHARIATFGLSFRGARFVEAQAGFLSGTPKPASTVGWATLDTGTNFDVDGGPQFLAPLGLVQLPINSVLTDANVLAGSFVCGMNVPLDEQWVVGKYSPAALDISKRTFALSMTLKAESDKLYKRLMYGGEAAAAWLTDLMREANFKLEFSSDGLADVGKPYKFAIKGNGKSGQDANVVWSAQPIGLRAGRQVIMQVSAVFLASPLSADEELTVELTNKHIASYTT